MANQEYLVRNRMTHWQKSYPHWVSVVSIIGVLLVWELICRAGFVSSLFLPAPSQIISSLFVMIGDGEIGMSLAASMYRIGLCCGQPHRPSRGPSNRHLGARR